MQLWVSPKWSFRIFATAITEDQQEKMKCKLQSASNRFVILHCLVAFPGFTSNGKIMFSEINFSQTCHMKYFDQKVAKIQNILLLHYAV